MARFFYTPEMVKWLRENSSGKWVSQITESFNMAFGLQKSEVAIRCALKNFKIKTEVIKAVKSGNNEYLHIKSFLTKIQIQALHDVFDGNNNAHYVDVQKYCSEKFGIEISASQTRTLCRNNKIVFGHGGRFKKGVTPCNKNKKITPETYQKLKKTMFTIGHKPHNRLPIGSEIKREGGVVYIKVAEPNIWKAKKHVVFENENNEKLNKHDCVIVLDGNENNLTVDNLVRLSPSENGHYIHLKQEGNNPKIKRLLTTLAKLEAKINEINKKN